MNKIFFICLMVLFFSTSVLAADESIDKIALSYVSQPAIGTVRGGTLAVPSPNSMESVTGTITGSAIQSSASAISLNTRIDKVPIRGNWFFSFAAESAPFSQPTTISAPTGSNNLDVVTFQTVGARIGYGKTTTSEEVKQKISKCCGLRRAGYQPSEEDKNECSAMLIDLNKNGQCTDDEKFTAVSNLLTGFNGEFGLRVLAADTQNPKIPGFAAELIASESFRTFGFYLSGYYLKLQEWEQQAGDTVIDRLANQEYKVSTGLHINSQSPVSSTSVVRYGFLGEYSRKVWDSASGEKNDSHSWEAAFFASGHFGDGFQGTVKLGASKLMENDKALYFITISPSYGSKL